MIVIKITGNDNKNYLSWANNDEIEEYHEHPLFSME